MLKEILGYPNLVDVLILGIFARIIWIGSAKGLIVEFFKLLGLLFAAFVTLHYFVRFAMFLQRWALLPGSLAGFAGFGILWLAITLIFKIVREGWMLMLNPEGKSPLWQRIGGGVLAFFRAILVGSMALMMIFASGKNVLSKQANASWSAFYLANVAPVLYKNTFDTFVSKFFPDEKINKAVLGLEDEDGTKQP